MYSRNVDGGAGVGGRVNRNMRKVTKIKHSDLSHNPPVPQDTTFIRLSLPIKHTDRDNTSTKPVIYSKQTDMSHIINTANHHRAHLHKRVKETVHLWGERRDDDDG